MTCRDCDRPATARGLCMSHWRRAKRLGEFTPRPYRRGGSPALLSGYLRTWAPDHPTASADGYALAHRLIAFDAGLLTDLSHEVHHVNHDPADNRLSNLVVLTPEQHRAEHALERRKESTDCIHGHVGEVARDRSGDRYCRACGRERAAARRATA